MWEVFCTPIHNEYWHSSSQWLRRLGIDTPRPTNWSLLLISEELPQFCNSIDRLSRIAYSSLTTAPFLCKSEQFKTVKPGAKHFVFLFFLMNDNGVLKRQVLSFFFVLGSLLTLSFRASSLQDDWWCLPIIVFFSRILVTKWVSKMIQSFRNACIGISRLHRHEI